MRLLAIDPGPAESAHVLCETDAGGKLLDFDKLPNERVLEVIRYNPVAAFAIEMVASYGMPVGAETFETCLWIGRFVERWYGYSEETPILVYRREVKLHLCGQPAAKDSNIRQALIDRYGGRDKAIGNKTIGYGPLHGVSKDVWSALAVAITAKETRL